MVHIRGGLLRVRVRVRLRVLILGAMGSERNGDGRRKRVKRERLCVYRVFVSLRPDTQVCRQAFAWSEMGRGADHMLRSLTNIR